MKYLPILMALILSGCCYRLTVPRKKSFKYYDKDFSLDQTSSWLKTNGYYYTIETIQNRTQCKFYHFRNDGRLVTYSSSCNNPDFESFENWTYTFGYYAINDDSTILFTKKSYYQHDETTIMGILSEEGYKLNIRPGRQEFHYVN